MTVRFRVLAAVVLTTPLLLSCTAKKTTGAVTMSLPATLMSQSASPGALSFPTLPVRHVVINVSGEGIGDGYWDSKVWSWDANSCRSNDSYATCAPPSTIEIPEIPNGAKFVQALFIAGEEDSAGEFWYGKVAIDLQGAVASAPITLTSVPGNASLKDGRISGRYYANALDANGSPIVINPTGKINVRFPVSNDRPMLVEQAEMYNGWFSVFGLDQISLRYDLDGESKLGSKYLLFSSTGLFRLDDYAAVGGNPVLRAQTIETYSTYEGRKEEANEVLIGSFGNGVAATPSLATCMDAPHTYESKVKVSGVPAFLSSVDLTIEKAPTVSHTVLCSAVPAPVEFSNFISFDNVAYDANGKDTAAGFKGPFQGFIDAGRFTFANLTGTLPNAAIINWDLLPGIDSTVIDGVKVYIRESQMDGGGDEEYRSQSGDGINCSALTSYGFEDLTPSGPVPAATTTLAVDLTSYDRAKVILCPVKAGVTLYSAVEAELEIGGTPSGSGTDNYQATSIQIKASDKMITGGTCAPFRIEAFRSGKPAGFGSNSDLTFSSVDPNMTFYTDSGCASTAFTTQTVDPEADHYAFYGKSINGGAINSSITVIADDGNAGSALTATKSFNLIISPAANTAYEKVRIVGPLAIKANECYPAVMMKWNVLHGVLVNTFSLSGQEITAPTDFEFFDGDSGNDPCTVSLAPEDLADGSKHIYFRYTGSATTASLDMVTSFTGGKIVLPTSMTVVHPGAAAKMILLSTDQTTINTCEMVQLVATDRNGNPTALLVPKTFDLYDIGSNPGTFHSDAACSGGSPITSIPMASGDVGAVFYFKANASPGSSTIVGVSQATPTLVFVKRMNVN